MKKYIAICLIIIILLILIAFIVFSFIFSPEYMYRIIRYGESDTMDYLIFDDVLIEKSENSFMYPLELDDSLKELEVRYKSNDTEKQDILENFLTDNQTTSFIVVKEEKIIFEEYYNDYKRDSVNTSFSSAKSLVSLLIGIAVDDGYIRSVDDEMGEYIKQLKGTDIGRTTIVELLSMRSNIKYEEEKLFFGDDAKTYYMEDLRKLAICDTMIDKKRNNEFHYNNYHPLLLGLVLENATSTSIPEYFEQKIWKKIGTEFDASWSVDSGKTGFAKMESGFNFRAVDFAKIGSMMLHEGEFNGNKIVSKEWIEESTIADFPIDPREYDNSLLEGCDTGYKYMWYSAQNGDSIDYFAAGKYGQFIYVSPKNEAVIVRTGCGAGDVDWWADVLMQVANGVQS